MLEFLDGVIDVMGDIIQTVEMIEEEELCAKYEEAAMGMTQRELRYYSADGEAVIDIEESEAVFQGYRDSAPVDLVFAGSADKFEGFEDLEW